MCANRFCWGPYFMAQLPYRNYIFHYIYGPHPSYARVIYSDPCSVKITLSRFALRSLRYVGWNFRWLCERHFQDFLWLAMQFIALLQEILSSQEKILTENLRMLFGQLPTTRFRPFRATCGSIRENKRAGESPQDEATFGCLRCKPALTLSVPRVINLQFPLQPLQKYYITQYGELGFS